MTPHPLIPHGLADIVLSESVMLLCLVAIAITLYQVKKKTNTPIQGAVFIGAGGYVSLSTLSDLYTNYGWSWIARGQFAGIALFLLLIITLLLGSYHIYKKTR